MAFKKPFHDLKTSAPLRSSDRRKLKQRVVQEFGLEQEAGDLLVPESLLSLKFATHLDELGVVYLSPDGDPLWFNIGKASNDLIPTVYTLWKRPTLLPVLSTPSAVIPVLMGGADLMIPGVVRHPQHVKRTDIVAVTRHMNGNVSGAPLAVGRMAVDAENLREGSKGKAVHILHTFGDSLWAMGCKAEPPEPKDNSPHLEQQPASDAHNTGGLKLEEQNKVDDAEVSPDPIGGVPDSSSVAVITPAEVTAILRTCTIQAIHSRLSTLPPSAFPIPSSTLYSNHVLPCRPVSSLSSPTPIDIKHSSHKNLTSFLKSLEKDGLLKLKDYKGDLNILGINASHLEVQSHKPYRTVGDKEKTEEKRAERERNEKEKPRELMVRELWKPHARSIHFFEQIGKSVKELYSSVELRTIVNDYVTERSLANPREQQYIHPDELLLSVLVAPKSNDVINYLKRDDAVKRLTEHMQDLHEITTEGKEPVIRKGRLKSISVVVKIRQGRKASTLIAGHEPFFITSEFLSEELKRTCATSTSVSPVQGKGNAMEVLVQGKQIKAVTELLVAQGVPKRWIEIADLSDKKK